MPHTLFISDLHLDEKHPTSYVLFKKFISEYIPSAEALYILGDLFELWVGDDYCSSFYEIVKKDLRIITKNIPVYFLHGNRDFAIGNKFARETGCSILPEFSVIKLYNKDVLLHHGDALCSLDEKHMKFRKQLSQNYLHKKLLLLLPLIIRKQIGRRLRDNSRQHHATVSSDLLQVVPDTIIQVLNQYQVNHMIHGHVHQARVFYHNSQNGLSERIVLGAWEQYGCVLKWHPNGKREMIFFDD